MQLTLLVALGLFMSAAPAAYANNCNWGLLTGGNWSSPGSWSGCGGGYPGQSGPDTANITGLSLSITVTVDVPVPSPVNLQVSLVLLPVTIDIPSGNSLTLNTGSSASNTNININGGTLGVAPGATVSNFGANVTVNAGAVSLGTLASLTVGNTFNFNGGTLQGAGTLGIPSGQTANFGGGPLAINSGLTFNNAGTLNLTTDNLITTDGISNPGITNSGTLRKTGGTTFSQINCRVDNSGTVNANALEIYLAGGGTHTGNFTGSIVAFNGAHTLNTGATLSSLGTVYLKGGTLLSNITPLTLPTMHHFDGALQSAGSIVANGAYTWDAGFIDGLGAPSPSLTATSFGGMTINGIGSNVITNNMVLTGNSSTITYVAQNFPLTLANGGAISLGLSTFNVQDANGRGIATSSGGNITIGANSTMVKNAAGTSRIDPQLINGTASSNLNVTAGALQINGGGSSVGAINNATSLHFVGGTFAVNGGTLGGAGVYLLSSPATLTISTTASATNLTENGGTLQVSSPNSLTVGGTLNFNGGTISGNGVAKSTGTLNIGAAAATTLDNGATLEVAGTANYNANNTNFLTLKNSSAVIVDNSPLGQFNFSTASQIGTDGTATHFDNLGVTTKSGAGFVQINPAFNQGGLAGAGLNVSGGVLALAAGTSNGPLSVAGGAFLDFNNGTFGISGGTTTGGAGTYKVAGGTLSVNAPISVANFLLFSGGVSGASNLTTTSSFVWDGGTLGGSGTANVSSGALTISGANGAMNLSRGLDVAAGATATYSSPSNSLMVTYPGGSITNSGMFTLATAKPIALSGAPPAGTYLFSNMSGATLNGNGAINVPVTNDGNLNPGTSPGSIAVNNAYTQTANGFLNIDLNGTAPGTQYDQLTVSGNATFGGTLKATLGYAPNAGDTFNVVTFASHTGDFATYNLPPIPGPPPGTIQHSLTSTAVQLVAVVPQADLMVTQTASPTSILHNQNATFSIKVTNNGPDVASGVVVTNSISGGTFVSYTAPTCTGAGPNCTIPSLGPGASETINMVVTGSAVGTMSNSASATTTSASDPNLTNNSATASVTVNGSADLGVTVSGPASAPAASNVTYTVTVGNVGPDPALPTVSLSASGGTLVSASGAGFTCATPASCSGSVLNPPTGTATLTVVVQAQSQAGTLVLTANAGPAASDPNLANNSSSATTTITALADLQLTKTLTTPMIAGTTVTYAITLKNAGPSDSAGVTLNENTPAGLTFVSASAPCSGGFPCSLGTVAAGTIVTINANYSLPANASGTITNTASVSSSSTPDPNSANDSASVSAAVIQNADVSVAKSGPASTQPGSNVTYTIRVTNNGPSNAAGVQLDDTYTPSTRLTFVSATGACSSFPCSLGNMSPGQNAMVQATYTVTSGPTTTVVNTATTTSATTDPNSSNNSASVSTTTGCPTAAPIGQTPADGATNVPLGGRFSWSDVSAGNYNVYLDEVGTNGSCSKFFAGVSATSTQFAGLKPGTTYQWRVEAVSSGCATVSSACMKFTTASTCPTTPPALTAPINTSVASPATFSWSSVGAADYKLFVNGTLIATTTSTTFGPVQVAAGAASWYVVAEFASPCTSLQSQSGTFNVSGCDLSTAPLPSLVGEAASDQGYDLSYTSVANATGYQVDESTDQNFAAAATTTQSVTATTVHYQHAVGATTAFYYRVRAVFPCGVTINSVTVRVVLAPFTPPTNPNVSVPVGNTNLVPIAVHVPGFPGQTLPFTASLDNRPWFVRVQPSSGALPPEGVDLTVFADPSNLPNGTFTGTLILLVTSPGSGKIISEGVQPVNVPVSISMVTPVTPKPAGTPPSNALIIPSVGHLDGISSKWQSDVRVANTGSQSQRYQLTFNPDDPSKGVKQTIITVDPGVTTALDDIIKTWYGIGSLGESANGVLEIRPLDAPGKGDPQPDQVSVSFSTQASSRTYNVTSNGTLGQFIPAIPFGTFVGRALDNAQATVLGLQQIAQSSAYRTNVGVLEASGQPASVLISAFDSSGNKLLDFPLDLKGGEQRQLNAFLAQNKISLDDGRLEVKVIRGDGKIAAYASVVDNRTGDPLLVSGVPLGSNASNHFVVPGVADLNTGQAAWRTDMRIFNPTTVPQFVTLTFSPQNGSGTPQMTAMTVNAGEVKRLDNVLASTFGLANTGGAMHVTMNDATPLVITARTFNLTSNAGTFGQFIPAVSSVDAIGKSDRPLHILQAEDSVRYRTNVGISEVTGEPATVEVAVFLPDSKVSPSTQIPIPANGFVQLPVIQGLGLTNVYNARVSVRVVDGDGKVSAYGSVIDQITQDPTFVPAQK